MTSPAKTTVWKRLYRCRRGAAIVEFAIVAPLLVALGVGVFEFGRAVQSYHVIDKGMRDAARYLGRGSATCDTNGNGSVTNVAQAKNLAMYGNTTGSGSLVLAFWNDPATITIPLPSCTPTSTNWVSTNGGAYIPIVTVAARVPYADLGLLGLFGLNAPTFGIEHQEVGLSE